MPTTNPNPVIPELLDQWGSPIRAQDPNLIQPAIFTRPAGAGAGVSLNNATEQLAEYRSWIYTCATMNANRIAELALIQIAALPVRGKKQVQRVEVEDHPFINLLYRPNPWMTRTELWLKTVLHLELTGNGFWLIVPDRLNIPRMIWPLQPDKVRIVPDAKTFISHYEYYPTGTSDPVILDNWGHVAHFKYPNPTDEYRGASPVQKQAHAIDADYYTMVYQRDFFVQGGRPDFAVVSGKPLTTQQMDQRYSLWEDKFQGEGKSHLPWFLNQGEDIKTLSFNNKDLELVALAGWNRDKIITAFGCKKGLLGLTDQVNFATLQAERNEWNRNTIKPKAKLIAEYLETFILQQLYPPPRQDGWWELNFENPVSEDREFELKQEAQDIQTGVRTIDEIRVERRGKDKVSWGGKPWFPIALVQPGTSAPSNGNNAKALTTRDTPAITTRTLEYNSERHQQLMRVYEQYREPVEKKLEKVVKRQFVRQGNETLKKLKQEVSKIEGRTAGMSKKRLAQEFKRGLVDDVLFDEKKEGKLFFDAMESDLRLAGEQGGLFATETLGLEPIPVPETVEQFIQVQTAERIVAVNSLTKEQIRNTLQEGLLNGETANQLASRVKGVFTQAKQFRALRIARTETGFVFSKANRETMKASGVVETKRWLAQLDESTRASHVTAHGQEVLLDNKFDVGGVMMDGPLDPSAPASLVVNCRCTETAGKVSK